MTTARRSHAQRQVEAEDRLTQALAELIAEQGYERTTAAQIGERAGYSRAAVRDRYGSKDALLVAVHARYERLLLGGPDVPPPATILEFMDRVEAFAREHPEWLRALFVVSFEAVGASTQFAPVVKDWVRTLEQVATGMLARQQADGTVRAEVDAPLVAGRLLDEAIGHAYRWTLGGGSADYAQYIHEWARRVVDDLRPA